MSRKEGVAPVHANSARAGLIRLEQLVQEAVITVPKELIAEAVNLVIHIEKAGHGLKIREIAGWGDFRKGVAPWTAFDDCPRCGHNTETCPIDWILFLLYGIVLHVPYV